MKKQRQRPVSAAIESLLGKNTPVPLLSPVDPDALMKDLIHSIKLYVIVSDEAALAVALWVVLSWCYELFPRCPLLLINAPERECGKTQLLKVVEFLAYAPLETTNITLAALFRVVANYGPTLLIDEADTFMEGKGELAGIVNKGYERGGVVLRIESDGHDLVERAYIVYGPKALAGIDLERHIPAATMSRGIEVPMKRKTKTDTVQRLRSADTKTFSDLRSRINRFVKDHRDVLANGWDQLPEELSDRQQDNWEPLLAIAHCFGSEWYKKTCEAARAICLETSPPKSSANQLLDDIRLVLQGYPKKYIPSADLLEKLNGNMEMDWSTYNRGQPLTSRQLSRFMSAYSIKSKTVRMGNNNTPKGYEVREFEDAFARYLEPLKSEEIPDIEVLSPADDLSSSTLLLNPSPLPNLAPEWVKSTDGDGSDGSVKEDF